MISTINIETMSLRKNGRRTYYRKVYNPRRTGHIAYDWGGAGHTQWEGTIKFFGRVLTVWGYAQYGRTPHTWADDTY